MVKSLRIKEFQSHGDTELHFSPDVNVIIGRNMVGKSSILRALRLLFYNKPEGKAFVTWGSKNATIEVEYEDHIIKRTKGAQNVYEVDGSIFSGFGRNIPEEVINALGFTAIQVDRNIYELNYDHPHEAPFFISETDAIKGKLFSKLGERVLSDLVLLDKSINSANATLRKLSSEQQVVAEQITTIEESLTVFAPLPDMITSFDSCKKSIRLASNSTHELMQLRSLQETLQEGAKERTFFEKLQAIDITPVVTAIENATELQREIKYMTQIAKAHTECSENTHKASSAIKILQNLPTDKLDQAQQLRTQLTNLYNVRTSLGTNNRNKGVVQKRQETIQAELDETLVSYGELLTAAKKCPLCLRPVETHDLDMILKELVGNDTSTIAEESPRDTG